MAIPILSSGEIKKNAYCGKYNGGIGLYCTTRARRREHRNTQYTLSWIYRGKWWYSRPLTITDFRKVFALLLTTLFAMEFLRKKKFFEMEIFWILILPWYETDIMEIRLVCFVLGNVSEKAKNLWNEPKKPCTGNFAVKPGARLNDIGIAIEKIYFSISVRYCARFYRTRHWICFSYRSRCASLRHKTTWSTSSDRNGIYHWTNDQRKPSMAIGYWQQWWMDRSDNRWCTLSTIRTHHSRYQETGYEILTQR